MAKGVYYGVKTELPDGYTPLEYIESSGTQYIDTRFKPNQDTRVVCKGIVEVGSSSRWLFGAITSSTSKAFGFAGSASGHYLSFYNTGSMPFDSSLNSSNPIIIDNNKGVATLTTDATSVTVTGTSGAFTCDYNLILFGLNNNGNIAPHSVRIYSCQIYDDGTLIRDFIPCVDSSSVVGLYDIVNGVFYTNAGSGTFTAGAETTYTPKEVARKCNKMYYGVKVELPDGYTPLEYIESSGTQWIDTEYIPTSDNMKIETKFSITTLKSWRALFGSEASGNGDWSISPLTNGSSALTFYVGSSSGIGSVAVSANTEYDFVCDLNSGTLSYDLNGTSGSLSVSGSLNKQNSIYIFTLNSSEAGNITGQTTSMKLYSFKLYDNGTLIRNFLPCKNSSGTIGLYDTVNGAFHANIGTGTFTAGTEFPTEVARKVKKGYIGIGGIARLFFGGSGSLTYYGTATSLSYGKYELKGATVGDYAIFAGGNNSSGGNTRTSTDAYGEDLTKYKPDSLGGVQYQHASASVGNYAIFAGGKSLGATNIVNVYDENLSRSTGTSLSTARHYLASANVGGYALFAGGNIGDNIRTSVVNAYDEELTRSTATSLSKARDCLAGTTVGNYALFAGGYDDYGNCHSTVDAYNEDLARSTPTALSQARYELASASVGNYALFAGGADAGGYRDTVDAYDENLTMATIESLSVARCYLAGTSLEGFAIFAGGYDWDGTGAVDAYDENLTRTTQQELSSARYNLAGATVGNYAFFAGGLGNSYEDTVDVYTIV